MSNEQMFCIARTVQDLNRTVKMQSDVIDLLFAFVAKHSDQNELAKLSEEIRNLQTSNTED